MKIASIKNYIPNTLTLSNLLLGCLAIVCAFTDRLDLVPWLLFWAGLADLFDGLMARWLKVASPIGLQLDSLADMVSFGVLPGVIMYQLLAIAFGETATIWHLMPAFMISVFSALRLAKFNVDERQTTGFVGLPTPGNTVFIGSMLYIVLHYDKFDAFILNPTLLYSLILAGCVLLVAEIPMFALKFNGRSWKGNEIKYLFLISCIILFAAFGLASGVLMISLYFVFSLYENMRANSKGREQKDA